MLKRLSYLILSLVLVAQTNLVFAQILNPVAWEWQAKETGENEYELIFTAKIDQGWYVYSQFLKEGGPVPTTFNFDENPALELIGNASEKGKKEYEGHDKLFDMNIKKFGVEASYIQKIRVKEATKVTGYLEFMTCDDTQCLPPDTKDFSFELGGSSKDEPNIEEQKIEVKTDQIENSSAEEIKGATINAETGTEQISSTLSFGIEQEQIFNPVSWAVEVAKKDANKYTVTYTATIQDGWYVYAQDLEEGGPVPTSFVFDNPELVATTEFADEISSNAKQGFDAIFEMEVKKFSKQVQFVQEISVQNETNVLTGYLEYMACDDKQCLPPDVKEFSLDLKEVVANLIDPLANEESGISEEENENRFALVHQCNEEMDVQKQSIWMTFFLGFIGGLIALLTPCVFPMIPLTVSFFTKQSSDRRSGTINALFYSFSIVLIFFILSLPFIIFKLPANTLNVISTNPILNLTFFIVFVVFAFSFFGYYEITLPSSWGTKLDSASGVGGFIGIFLMAMTLGIVSFSCTGPILGSVLALSADGGQDKLVAGMLGFGVALAIPFGLFAAFPNLLNSLPKSGGWLNDVKVNLGFIELALAFKFLSTADLIGRYGFLKYEVFVAAWIIIGILMLLYNFGIFKLKYPVSNKKATPGKLAYNAMILALVLYMFTAFKYDEKTGSFTTLSLLSGLAPPTGYSFVYPSDCPSGLSQCFKNKYKEGLAYAKEQNKPVFLDFTGHGCQNCRKMENTVWNKSSINKVLNEDYVVISLYVDERTEIPEDEQYVSEVLGKKIRREGDRWAEMEVKYFRQNSQPLYVIMTPDEELLNAPVGYTPNEGDFSDFLSCGLNGFEEIGMN